MKDPNPPYQRVESAAENVDYGWSSFRARKESGWTWRKTVAGIVQLLYVPFVYWILFVANLEPVGVSNKGDTGRSALVLGHIAFVMAFYTAKLFYWERQFMLIEMLLLILIYPLILGCIAFFARGNSNPLGWVGYASIPVVVVGVYLNYWPELLRAQWKKVPNNRGRLYTLGHFSYVRNVNYLGDVLWTAGIAMAAGWKVSWYPILTLLVLVCMYIPEKESYLAKRYADEWPAYRERTVRLIPFLY